LLILRSDEVVELSMLMWRRWQRWCWDRLHPAVVHRYLQAVAVGAHLAEVPQFQLAVGVHPVGVPQFQQLQHPVWSLVWWPGVEFRPPGRQEPPQSKTQQLGCQRLPLEKQHRLAPAVLDVGCWNRYCPRWGQQRCLQLVCRQR